jgi:hypothetical protein
VFEGGFAGPTGRAEETTNRCMRLLVILIKTEHVFFDSERVDFLSRSRKISHNMVLISAAFASLSLLSASQQSVLAKPLTWPKELYSPLVPTKVLATANNLPNLTVMPYESYPSTGGAWGYRITDWWTAGYFPATAYSLHTRATLCEPSDENGLNQADWLELGRYLLNPIAELSFGNTQNHDQGFMSLGLQADIQMYVYVVSGFATSHVLTKTTYFVAIPITKRQSDY